MHLFLALLRIYMLKKVRKKSIKYQLKSTNAEIMWLCNLAHSHTHWNTHRNTHMCITSDPYLGVCPGEIGQVGRDNAQTGDLKFLSLQGYWLLLADWHRRRGACRETGGCANRQSQVMWPGKQTGKQRRQTCRQVVPWKTTRSKGLDLKCLPSFHPEQT